MTSLGDPGAHATTVARAVAKYLDVLHDGWHELTDDERRAAVRVASDAVWRVAGGRRGRGG